MTQKTKTMYLVMNRANNEGTVFESKEDANHAAGIKRVRGFYSSLAENFEEYYTEDGPLTVQEIEIPS